MIKPIRFLLNGQDVTTPARADTTVLEYLRGEAQLRGTKEGCAEGDCGACSVLFAPAQGEDPAPVRLQAANSCILLLGQVDGGSLVTVEGLAASCTGGHPVQNRMAENGSSQCGFCTPGIVTALAGLLDSNPDPTHDDIHDALAGNLCRCTGYRPIVEAALSAARETAPELPMASKSASPKAGSQESHFLRPSSLDELHTAFKNHPDAVLLAGGTDLSLDVAHARASWETAIGTQNVREMRIIEEQTDQIVFGAAVTWQDMLPLVHHHWPSFATLLRRFGSTQIRAMGTIGGNLATASPIGDSAPALLALNAQLKLSGPDGERELPLSDFFLDYRKTVLRRHECIVSVAVPKTAPGTVFRVYKISKRYDQDISTVCGAFCLDFEGERVREARIAFGGMAAVPLRVAAAEQIIIGQTLNEVTIQAVGDAIAESLTPMSDMRGSAAYRSKVAANLLHRIAAERAGETVEVIAI